MADYVRILYRRILCEGSAFFDDRTRTYIVNRARTAFRANQGCTDEARVKSKLREARKFLHRIERANRGVSKSALKLMQSAYGQNGKTRHRLLQPYTILPGDLKVPEPLVASAPRTAPPPPLCGPLTALITTHLKKKVAPVLPKPEYKPLHPGREANLLWRHRTDLLDRVTLPLPFEIVCELERKAGAPETHPLHAANLRVGGPMWVDLYNNQETHTDFMHLCPTAKLVPKSKLLRKRLPLPPSPNAAEPSPYATLSLVQFVNPNFKMEEQQYISLDKEPRKSRRMYRRLLTEQPLISPLPTSSTMWDTKVKFQVSYSAWVPGSITGVQQDSDISEAV